MKLAFVVVSALMLFDRTTLAQPSVQAFGSAEVKGSAAKQIAYAKLLIQAIPVDRTLRQAAALNAITALRVVQDKWPDQSASVVEAQLLLAHVFENQNMLPNALEALVECEKRAQDVGRSAQVYAREGEIKWRLRRPSDAVDAFTRAVDSPGFDDMTEIEQMRALNEFAEAQSELGRHRQASMTLRRATKLPGLDSFTRLVLTSRLLDKDELGSDSDSTKKDLKDAERILDEVLRERTLPPADNAEFQQISDHVKKLRAKTGG